jgi:pantetheine-phosphate adenylyltransferase
MAMMNRRLMRDLEIVFLMTDDEFFYISSSMVREVAKLGGDVKGFVPPQVYRHLRARFGSRPGNKKAKKK